MEELKTDAEATTTAAAADAPMLAIELDVAGHHYAFRGLSRRVLVMVGASALLLFFVLAGLFAYRGIAARNAEKEAAAAAAKLAANELAAREAKEREEMARIGLEMKQRHLEIMEASPSRPPVEKTSDATNGSAATATSESPAAAEGGGAAAATARAAAEKVAGREGTSPQAPVEVASPEAAGSCTLEGKTPEDYGKALARCLEEYSRQEGRPPPAQGTPATQRRR